MTKNPSSSPNPSTTVKPAKLAKQAKPEPPGLRLLRAHAALAGQPVYVHPRECGHLHHGDLASCSTEVVAAFWVPSNAMPYIYLPEEAYCWEFAWPKPQFFDQSQLSSWRPLYERGRFHTDEEWAALRERNRTLQPHSSNYSVFARMAQGAQTLAAIAGGGTPFRNLGRK